MPGEDDFDSRQLGHLSSWADKRYIRRDEAVLRSDGDYRKLVSLIPVLEDVEKMQHAAEESLKSSWRVEKYLVGGFNDDGTYVHGVTEKIGQIPKLNVALWSLAILVVTDSLLRIFGVHVP